MDLNLFTLIGEIVVICILVVLVLMIITSVLGLILLKNKKLVFPRILLFTLNITYPSLKSILKLLQFDDLAIDRISIDLRNRLNKDKFKELNSEDVIVVLPHCLRSTDCPAKLGTSGLECLKCGKCPIGIFKEICDKKNMGVYIVPGSTFMKNIIRKREFKGVIGVACPVDLNNAMTTLENYVTQGVYLLNDGCINTLVDVDEVIDLINVTQPVTSYTKEDFM
ncbi:DUF116 domain-containing protein [uncultured Methanosphaera sp.]|uniref:DUF116 domain-containing protein n=1 Tax=uncultured Methanosphaera sp. TaxID=262501 RepID=UPI002600E614|nr:DUF116 domain-containing protein [uncultured Methanosphaera sp.]